MDKHTMAPAGAHLRQLSESVVQGTGPVMVMVRTYIRHRTVGYREQIVTRISDCEATHSMKESGNLWSVVVVVASDDIISSARKRNKFARQQDVHERLIYHSRSRKL